MATSKEDTRKVRKGRKGRKGKGKAGQDSKNCNCNCTNTNTRNQIILLLPLYFPACTALQSTTIIRQAKISNALRLPYPSTVLFTSPRRLFLCHTNYHLPLEKPFQCHFSLTLLAEKNSALPSLLSSFFLSTTLHACRRRCLMGQFIPRADKQVAVGRGQFFSLVSWRKRSAKIARANPVAGKTQISFHVSSSSFVDTHDGKQRDHKVSPPIDNAKFKLPHEISFLGVSLSQSFALSWATHKQFILIDT